MATAQINDAKRAAFVTQGFSGTIDEMALDFYLAGGATENQINQAAYEWLAVQGFTQSSLPDRWKAFLNTTYPGLSRSDAELKFWQDGGVVGSTYVLSGYVLAGYVL